jgi:hypothetical protein
MDTPPRTPDPIEEHRRRIEAWVRTGDMSALWPHVRPDDRRQAHAEIRGATAAVLAGRPAAALPRLTAVDDRRRTALGVAAFMSGMGPLLGWWIEQGELGADHRVRDLFREHLDHGRRRAARLHGELGRIAAAMRAEGIEPVVLKGTHTGAVYFPEPGTRPATDLDLLVRPDERDRASAALRKAGFVEARRTRYADRSEWQPAGAPQPVRSLELDHALNPLTVDLHTRLERWYFRGLRASLDARAPAGAVEGPPGLGEGPDVRVLAQPELTAFLALHAGHDPTRLRLVHLVELVLVLRRDVAEGRLDPGALAALLERTGTARFAHPALALTEELAPGTVEPALLASTAQGATRRTLRVLADLRAADLAPLPRPSLDAKVMWARGPREWLLNLSELVVPSDDGRTVGLARLQWRRLRALLTGRARWRAGGA